MTAAVKLTEDLACSAIMREQMRRALCLPRFTPRKWWECDVFELTGSGYFREYEVKLTVADFKNDAKKSVAVFNGYGQPRTERNKHASLAAGDVSGPVEFYFVTPKGLIAPEMVPAWAGLIELSDRGEDHKPTARWWPLTTVKAPRLHTTKAHVDIRRAVLSSCYYRMHILADAVRNNTRPPSEWPAEQMEAPALPDLSTLSSQL